MTIKTGEKLPEVTLTRMGADGPEQVTTSELFAGKKVVLFAVPGAFTPTCHSTHLPGYVSEAAGLKQAGVDNIYCLATNDVFVLKAWEEASGSMGAVEMISDGNADLIQETGLFFDGSDRGLGIRPKRFSMIINDCVVEDLNIEDAPPMCDITSAVSMKAKV